jgi:hypothetical protein
MQRIIFTRQQRKSRGSVLALAALTLTFLILPFGLFAYENELLLATQAKYKSQMEAAALLVAGQLSRLVVNDEHFGFVSLSNDPPIGKATQAADGEACPVTSINNLLATIRLDDIIAGELYDDNLSTLSNADYDYAQSTVKLLQTSLVSAVDCKNKSKFCDMDGNELRPYQAAQTFLANNLRSVTTGQPVHVRNLRISLGFLSQGGPTNTPVPQPLQLAQLQNNCQENGNYKSGVDVKYCHHSFYFAQVAEAPALVDESTFAAADGKRFSSIVKVEADISYFDLGASAANKECWLHVAACAVPCEQRQVGPSGAMLVFFPCGETDLKSVADLLRLRGGEATQAYRSSGGDLPLDQQASPVNAALAPWGDVQSITSDHVIASGLYCWLRACGIRPRIDSVLSACRQEFYPQATNNNLLYEFDLNGNVIVSSLPAMPLPQNVLSDQQLFVEIKNENYSIGCYNNVYNLGTINGGKHAGQPLAGDPINWCELPYFGLSKESAAQEGKGGATGLTASNTIVTASEIPGAVLKDTVEFETAGKPVTSVPRKSYYSGGLAVELSISQL